MSQHHEIERLRHKIEELAAAHAILLKSYTATLSAMTKANLVARVTALEKTAGN